MKTLTIVRKKWARGGKNGTSMLRNKRGAMCCLGFYAKKLGATDQMILGVSTPDDLMDKFNGRKKVWRRRLKGLVICRSSGHLATKLSSKLMSENDDVDTAEHERESRIATLFLKLGVKVKFK